ncbi:DJ-1/PfpI family protein [Altererythrobacter sp. FM1]|uniref:DJ-1/PfpI family protein n=1 Tax=Tsuneonella flava TaxID=2055955 RepID=UPI000C80F632|nr:DJ-1/PfpI family protein [Tsuneonella flava]ROT94146.1 DJ-1/PfpI family protein [Altererythrobacter sp. FM1]
MTIDRRALLGGITGAAMLAPFLALERAMAQTASAASGSPSLEEQQAMAAQHDTIMQDLLGENLFRQEEIAMLVYPKFTALDLVGPHYFFACLFGAKVHLVTTEADLSPLASDLGLAIAPTMRMRDVPADLDVLFVPGGTEGTLAAMARPDVMSWVRDRASRARHITSVCTGSMILAKAGLLQGKQATSHWVTRPVLADYGATPVDERVVKDGNIVTGAGVSAGLDFAIALVEMLRGRNYAEALVLQAEYAPEPPIRAGTLDTTSPDVGNMMNLMFAPVAEQFRALSAS